MQTPSYGFQNTQGARDMANNSSPRTLNEFGKVNTMGGTSTPFNAYTVNPTSQRTRVASDGLPRML